MSVAWSNKGFFNILMNEPSSYNIVCNLTVFFRVREKHQIEFKKKCAQAGAKQSVRLLLTKNPALLLQLPIASDAVSHLNGSCGPGR